MDRSEVAVSHGEAQVMAEEPVERISTNTAVLANGAFVITAVSPTT